MDQSLIKKQVREYWDENVHNWKVAKFNAGDKRFFEEIERYRFEKLSYLTSVVDFNGYSGKKLLDVGCGLGNDLSRFVRGGAEGVGIDISAVAVNLARKNFKYRNLSASFIEMDAENMAFSDNSFDIVYCHTVIHFTPDPQFLINEVHRVLKPGGLAILMTVNRNSWLYFLHRLTKLKIDYMDAPVFNKYSIDEFKSMLSPFDNVQLKTERFPVKTEVHKGIKAMIYNVYFVALFNALPKLLTRNTGYHLLAFAYKK